MILGISTGDLPRVMRPAKVVNQAKLKKLDAKVLKVARKVGTYVGVATAIALAGIIFGGHLMSGHVGLKIGTIFAGGAFGGIFFGMLPTFIIMPKINIWRAKEYPTKVI